MSGKGTLVGDRDLLQLFNINSLGVFLCVASICHAVCGMLAVSDSEFMAVWASVRVAVYCRPHT